MCTNYVMVSKMSQIEFLLEQALRLQGSGQFEEAQAILQRILRLEPAEVNALHFSGLLNFQLGLKQEALQYLKKAIVIAPNFAELHSNFAHILQDMGQLDLALKHGNIAFQLAPDMPEAHHHLANILQEKNQLEKAHFHYKQALQLQPAFPEAHCNLARLYQAQNQLEKALEHFAIALQQAPDFEQVNQYRGVIYFQQGYLTRTIKYLEQVSNMDEHIHHMLAVAYQGRGQYNEAFFHFQKALALAPLEQRIYSNYLLCLNWSPNQSKKTIFETFRDWGKSHLADSIERTCGPKIKVGYLSPDFRRHSAIQIFLPLFKYHNRNQFEIYAYSNVQKTDAVTRQFQELAHGWRDISILDDEQCLALIKSDEIDILVDLSGHTSHHRLSIFAQRAAPLQLTGLGFGCTTGLRNIDYRITDRFVVPFEEARYNVEKIAYLNSIFLWNPPDFEMPLFKRDKTDFVFGSMNSLFKLTQPCIMLWLELLNKCPNSKLLIKAEQFKEVETLEWFVKYYALPEEQLILLSESSHQEHLSAYNQIDLLLDPFPTQGGITTCEALWMGTPVLTMAGGTRTGDSILTQLGLKNLIAQSPQEYLEKAYFYYQNREQLESMSNEVKERLLNSAICQSEQFVKNLEQLYQQLWNLKLSPHENDD